MSEWSDELQRRVQKADLVSIREQVACAIEGDRADLEHVIHHAFQIQRGSMQVPPHPAVIEALTDSKWIPPIFRAVYRQEVDDIRHLVSDSPEVLELQDQKGCTPLLRAAETCKLEVITTLVLAGSNLHAVNQHGFGCLHLSGWNEVHPGERLETLSYFAAAGCEVNARSDHEATPLMLAAMCFKADSVQRLLELGADPSLRSDEGKTALEYAASSGDQAVISALKAVGI